MNSDIVLWILTGLIFILFAADILLLIRHNNVLSRVIANNQQPLEELRGVGFFFRIFAYISIVVCLFIGMHYICVHYPRIIPLNSLGADYIGIIIGILSGMITLLVGWQIFNNIQERERIRDIRNQFENFRNQTRGEIGTFIDNASERNQNIILAVVFAQMGLVQLENGELTSAVRSLFNSLSADVENNEMQNDARIHAIEMLEQISILTRDNPNNPRFEILAPLEDRRLYQRIALNLNNDLIIDLIDRIQLVQEG